MASHQGAGNGRSLTPALLESRLLSIHLRRESSRMFQDRHAEGRNGAILSHHLQNKLPTGYRYMQGLQPESVKLREERTASDYRTSVWVTSFRTHPLKQENQNDNNEMELHQTEKLLLSEEFHQRNDKTTDRMEELTHK